MAFQYPNHVSGFDHALVILVEQDGARDQWATASFETTQNGATFTALEFVNLSYPWSAPNTSGDRDDVGRRQRIFPVKPGPNWTSKSIRFSASQPDTDPGLEFYAVIAIVAVAGGLPVAQLGDVDTTATLSIN